MSEHPFRDFAADSPVMARHRPRPLPLDSPHGTMLRRFIAAHIDMFLALALAGGGAKLLPESWIAVQTAVFIGGYFAYFLILEWRFSSTPGKYVTGLTIRDYHGQPCTLKQSLIRTSSRIFEANPIFNLPAALCIIFSRDRQRFGDRFAGTVVVSVT